ncbi:MAG: DsbC family protein [Lysobacter sp.]|nr:MAG: DsbC family protein [Lysobacter sp.]
MKILLSAVLGAMSLSACAQAPETGKAPAAPAAGTPSPKVQPAAGTPDARALAAVRALSPSAVVDHVGAAPIPGFREVVVAGQVAYASDDGKYLFVPGQGGSLFEVSTRKDLTEGALSKIRRGLVATIPAADRIIFAPENPKHRVTVFTDISCGFCRKMHSEMAEYNRQGIAVEYVAFPRAGIGSADYRQMVSVWCAHDRRKALTDAKNDRPVPARTCKTTVDQQYDVGQRAGLTGTPMVIAEDGRQIGGYVPPARMRQVLDELAAKATPAKGS